MLKDFKMKIFVRVNSKDNYVNKTLQDERILDNIVLAVKCCWRQLGCTIFCIAVGNILCSMWCCRYLTPATVHKYTTLLGYSSNKYLVVREVK